MIRILLFILLLPVFTYSQIVTVKDAKSNNPLEYVSISCSELNRTVNTDAKGRADITIFKDCNELLFRLIGYRPIKLSYAKLVENDLKVLMKDQPVALGNVVVSANRWEEEKNEISHNIEYIGLEEIKINNPQTAADMLSQTGNVYVQKSQLGGGSPMIRGFAANRVLIVVDNVRMNNAIFRSGNLQNVINVDVNSLSNAQVIFGPASVVFGSDAIGGVMDFNTLSPTFSAGDDLLLKGNVLGRYSSANKEKTGSINLSLGLEKWSFLSSFTFSKFDDLMMGSNGPDDYLRPVYQERIGGKDSAVINSDPKLQKGSAYDQLNFMQKIRFKPDTNWELNYGFYYSTTSDIPRYDRLIELSNGIPKSGDWYYGPQKWMMNNLTLTNFSRNNLYDLARVTVAHQHFEESRHDRKFKKNDINHRVEKVSVVSANLDFIKSINLNSQLYYGFETVFNKVSSTAELENISTNVVKPLSTRYPDGSIWNSYAVYLSYKNKLSEQYVLQTGIRYNLVHVNADFDTTFFPFPFTNADLTTGALTGSAGLVYRPMDDLQFNLNLSTGFRAPNMDDIGKVFDSEPGSVIVPNPSLTSEYIYSGEIGLMKIFNETVKVELSGFYSYLDNAMVRRDFNLNGADSIMYDGTMSRVQAIQNAAFAYIWGIQAGVHINPLPGLSFTSRFTYHKGEEEDDAGNKTPLRHAAPWYGSTRLSYEYDIYKAVFYADYNGEVSYDNLSLSERDKPVLYAKDDNGNPYSPAWLTLNFKFSVNPLPNLILDLGVENITDKRYRTYSSGITAPGRNFIGSVRVNF
ncbi:MAG TPA: TonB-dependent receptor [Ignavibacteriaceae bacterium]|jgi:hemoglobin/transferrin/lactoferrin receptor protein|nr:TonB-dependent receptor [Ignavibacteriaceae bacterium]